MIVLISGDRELTLTFVGSTSEPEGVGSLMILGVIRERETRVVILHGHVRWQGVFMLNGGYYEMLLPHLQF